ncbi:sensor histidine kinase [Gloeothece verrucosa]|uniref:histidine kinase n=1 Tax=Gloeothece verrucosa (strain PCC 7822) TaxID=497965 RepID=E0UL02_GLOV7|nr:ATP-binding protein [Gloeothece verrucosa]ADN17632.1 multi-sensor signal transduction histidine kinase [Gloeothece verrucosa PCC 7822]
MSQPLRVLLIDDNRSDRTLIIRELQRVFLGLQVQEVIDAQAFEQAINVDTFDVVVTDYELGWSNGLEVLRTVKAHYPRCPVVMFTNTGTEEIAVEALKSGLDDYIIKEPGRYIRVPTAISLALERIETRQRAILLQIRLQGLLNQLKVGIFRSISNGILIEANRAFLELLGVSSLAQANEMYLIDTRECYRLLVNLEPPQRQEREVQIQRGDNTFFWALLTTTLNSVEGIRVVDGLLEDITQRKQAEAALEQLNNTLEARVIERTAQLEEANQDLEEFAYSVSHDLRAPLRTIQGFTQLLLEDKESFDLTKLEYIQRIAANAQKLDVLITELLSYSRLKQTEIELEPVNLSLLLTHVLTEMDFEMRQRQAEVSIEEPLPMVQANLIILIQVLTNLLANAVKFVPLEESSTSNVHPQVRIWAQLEGEQCRLWIEDNGIGIPLAQQQQIFRPFTRLHSEEEYPGTGIGLAIVRKGVERMGGAVGVESQPGQGSRFWIQLALSI